jgi:hypothetical protein
MPTATLRRARQTTRAEALLAGALALQLFTVSSRRF